jgi:hypothetical protein
MIAIALPVALDGMMQNFNVEPTIVTAGIVRQIDLVGVVLLSFGFNNLTRWGPELRHPTRRSNSLAWAPLRP